MSLGRKKLSEEQQESLLKPSAWYIPPRPGSFGSRNDVTNTFRSGGNPEAQSIGNLDTRKHVQPSPDVQMSSDEDMNATGISGPSQVASTHSTSDEEFPMSQWPPSPEPVRRPELPPNSTAESGDIEMALPRALPSRMDPKKIRWQQKMREW